MVQSDTLSQWPNYCPSEDNDNEDIIMLPDNLFVNLIDIDLQDRIATSGDLDCNAAEAIKLLLEIAPATMTAGLQDWTTEVYHGHNILFYKGEKLHPMRHSTTTRHCTEIPQP